MNKETDTNKTSRSRLHIVGEDVSPFSGFGQWLLGNGREFREVLTSLGLDTSSATRQGVLSPFVDSNARSLSTGAS